LLETDLRMPKRLECFELAGFVLTKMEGGVMQARTYRDVACFDRAVRQLRTYFGYLGRGTAWQQMRSRAMAGINLWAVLMAATVAFAVGGIWYAPLLFGEGWQTNPRLPEHLRAHKPALIFGIGFLLSLIAALMFAIFLGPHPSMQLAVVTGCVAGLTWVATGFARNYRSRGSIGKSLELSLINGGFHAVQFMVLGLVFANFQ
jgi:hypothetical protein